MAHISDPGTPAGDWVVGLDASRNRSGGGKTHLINLIEASEPQQHGIAQVHVWAYKDLLDAVPDRPWLTKHAPAALEASLPKQLIWQMFSFPREFREAGCDIVLNTDAGTLSSIRPSVTMSRDMLSYEPGEIERFGWTKARLRLIALRYVQNRSLRNADGVIFLTRYAANIIQQSCGKLPNVGLIPHGIGDNFRVADKRVSWPTSGERPIRCLYISNAALHKHQWKVVEALALLRAGGLNVELQLVGGGSGAGQERLSRQIAMTDPDRAFVSEVGAVPNTDLPNYLVNADLFVFASSCENMPNTLVEAMASGIPIACARRGPMPEVLEDGGIYFDPESPCSIADAIKHLIGNENLRQTVSTKAQKLSRQYSWRRCAAETWSYLAETCAMSRNGDR